jgi:hypothetical protein
VKGEEWFVDQRIPYGFNGTSNDSVRNEAETNDPTKSIVNVKIVVNGEKLLTR